MSISRRGYLRRVAITGVAIVVAALSCKGRDTTSPAAVAGVSILPNAATVVDVGATKQFTATALGANGSALQGETVTWTSSDSTVAKVTANGLATGISPGTATLTATCGAQSATVSVVVQEAVAHVIVQQILPELLAPGGVLLVEAAGDDANGNVLPDTVSNWSSSNAAVATVTAIGPTEAHVTGVGQGPVTITATINGVTGSVVMNVEAQGAVTAIVVAPAAANFVESAQGVASPIQLTTTLKDSSANLVSGLVTWSSSDTSVATVSASGLVTARTGATSSLTATITATTGAISAAVPVTVNPQVVALIVTPTTDTLGVGQLLPLRVVALDVHGDTLTGVKLSWSAVEQSTFGNTPTVRFSALGADTAVVTALAVGTATITVRESVGGASAKVALVVTESLSDALTAAQKSRSRKSPG